MEIACLSTCIPKFVTDARSSLKDVEIKEETIPERMLSRIRYFHNDAFKTDDGKDDLAPLPQSA